MLIMMDVWSRRLDWDQAAGKVVELVEEFHLHTGRPYHSTNLHELVEE